MNDLLGDVKPKDASVNPTYAGGDIEMGEVGLGTAHTGATEKGQAMRAFFGNVESIKNDMAEIRALQREVIAMHEKSKTIVKSKDMERHREDMQDTINQINIIAKKVKQKVEMQEKDNDRAKKMPGQGKGSANERTRTTITAGLKKKLKELMGEFSGMRNRIQDEYREVVEKRVYTVTGKHVPEEEIDRMIDTGDAEQIFHKAIMEQV